MQRWSVVVPAKGLTDAKTRLGPTGSRRDHDELVLALLGDTLDAVAACPVVADLWVVTDDARAAAVATELGARVLAGAPAGLNPALAHADAVLRRSRAEAAVHPTRAEAAVRRTRAAVRRNRTADAVDRTLTDDAQQAGPAVRLAALHSDLPALRPAELAEALGLAAALPRSSVPDAEGTGTVLLATTDGPLEPAFGPGSAAAHAASGAVPLGGAWPGLRRDVDTPAHLAQALHLGCGPRTAERAPRACA
ncbi:2-phospho-L-lactate guanylyltransferase [Klenkia sp. LSe6-5]|uniref:2-phospho-L-lactate guanylyltransferase n=1 Tax=Klenkia sesuvii TaxID=3103137 RepID=A0ABU8DY97_9ACTN